MDLVIRIEPSFRYSVTTLLENFHQDVLGFEYPPSLEPEKTLPALQVSTERVIASDHGSIYVRAVVGFPGLELAQVQALTDVILAGARWKYGTDKVQVESRG